MAKKIYSQAVQIELRLYVRNYPYIQKLVFDFNLKIKSILVLKISNLLKEHLLVTFR